MNLFYIAWRNLMQRKLATLLTTLSMALGVALVVIVLSVGWVITESFSRNKNAGYNLIVGAKGGAMQLTLNTVFYLSRPIETLPYETYLDLLPGDERQEEIRRIGGRIANPDEPGEFSAYMQGGFAIPVCLGDYYGPFRVVGTKPDFFEDLVYGEEGQYTYEFSSGRNFKLYSEENQYFEAVLGSLVAKKMNKKVGDTLQTTHGDPEGQGHDIEFKIVGILAPTGTPNDRAAFINIEGFYLMDGHARGFEDLLHPDEDKVDVPRPEMAGPEMLPLEERDVTAILVRPGGMMGMQLQPRLSKKPATQAVSPIGQVNLLFDSFVSPIRDALLGVTIAVCIVSAISILVGIYNSMSERKRDIAVMRALGASRDTVFSVILLESLVISVLGGVVGWIAAHAVVLCYSNVVEEKTGLQLGFFSMSFWELMLLPGLIVLAVLAGFLPAMAGYRTDVSKNLSS